MGAKGIIAKQRPRYYLCPIALKLPPESEKNIPNNHNTGHRIAYRHHTYPGILDQKYDRR
jgi:hypothetical protein